MTLVLAIGMLCGCQHEPATSFFEFPPPTEIPPPAAASAQPPKLARVATHTFMLAKDRRIVGRLAAISVQDGDTLPDIARHFGLGYNEITLANPTVRPWSPQTGERVLLPLRFILPDAPRKRGFNYVTQLSIIKIFGNVI